MAEEQQLTPGELAAISGDKAANDVIVKYQESESKEAYLKAFFMILTNSLIIENNNDSNETADAILKIIDVHYETLKEIIYKEHVYFNSLHAAIGRIKELEAELAALSTPAEGRDLPEFEGLLDNLTKNANESNGRAVSKSK